MVSPSLEKKPPPIMGGGFFAVFDYALVRINPTFMPDFPFGRNIIALLMLRRCT